MAQVKLILREDVPALGDAGDLVAHRFGSQIRVSAPDEPELRDQADRLLALPWELLCFGQLLALDVLDLRRHPLEVLERALVRHRRHGLLNALRRLGTLLTGHE